MAAVQQQADSQKRVALFGAGRKRPSGIRFAEHYLAFARGLATSRTQPMNVCTTGLTILPFNVTIPTDHGRIGNSIGKIFNGDLLVLKRSTEPDNAEIKRSVAIKLMHWCVE